MTGKVTQTVMRTSAQKVFRPEKGSVKKEEVKSASKVVSSTKNRPSVEKI